MRSSLRTEMRLECVCERERELSGHLASKSRRLPFEPDRIQIRDPLRRQQPLTVGETLGRTPPRQIIFAPSDALDVRVPMLLPKGAQRSEALHERRAALPDGHPFKPHALEQSRLHRTNLTSPDAADSSNPSTECRVGLEFLWNLRVAVLGPIRGKASAHLQQGRAGAHSFEQHDKSRFGASGQYILPVAVGKGVGLAWRSPREPERLKCLVPCRR